MTLSVTDAKSGSAVLAGLDDTVVESHLNSAALFLDSTYCVTDEAGKEHENYDAAQLILAEHDAAGTLFVAATGGRVIEEEKQLDVMKKRTKWQEGSENLSASQRFPKAHYLMLAIGELCASGSTVVTRLERG